MRRRVHRTCSNPACGKLFGRFAAKLAGVTRPTCSTACRNVILRDRGPRTPRILRAGYPYLCVGRGQPMADARGYCAESRVVMARTLGRPLAACERVYHRDGDRLNCAPDNLFLQRHRA